MLKFYMISRSLLAHHSLVVEHMINFSYARLTLIIQYFYSKLYKMLCLKFYMIS